jgi:hypothetical protein
VLVLRELAEHAPEVFNVHISSFIDAVWPALRDSRLFARQAAVRALRACLVVIERRETRYRVQWYYRLYEETQNGLKRDESGRRARRRRGRVLRGSQTKKSVEDDECLGELSSRARARFDRDPSRVGRVAARLVVGVRRAA